MIDMEHISQLFVMFSLSYFFQIFLATDLLYAFLRRNYSLKKGMKQLDEDGKEKIVTLQWYTEKSTNSLKLLYTHMSLNMPSLKSEYYLFLWS